MKLEEYRGVLNQEEELIDTLKICEWTYNSTLLITVLALKFAFRKACWKCAFLSPSVAHLTEKKSGFSPDTLLKDKNKQRIFFLPNLAMPFGD